MQSVHQDFMVKLICQYQKILDCFSMCPCPCLHVELIFAHSMLVLDLYLVWLTLITLICFDHLPRQKPTDHLRMKNSVLLNLPAMNRQLIQTINPVCMQTPTSYHSPALPNLWEKKSFAKGLGSHIQKSVPSTMTRQDLPQYPANLFSHLILKQKRNFH